MNNFIDGCLDLSLDLFEFGINNKGVVNSCSNFIYLLYFSLWKIQPETFFLKHYSWKCNINTAINKALRLDNNNSSAAGLIELLNLLIWRNVWNIKEKDQLLHFFPQTDLCSNCLFQQLCLSICYLQRWQNFDSHRLTRKISIFPQIQKCLWYLRNGQSTISRHSKPQTFSDLNYWSSDS